MIAAPQVSPKAQVEGSGATSPPSADAASIRRDEADSIRKLLRQANSLREALTLLDMHINGIGK